MNEYKCQTRRDVTNNTTPAIVSNHITTLERTLNQCLHVHTIVNNAFHFQHGMLRPIALSIRTPVL